MVNLENLEMFRCAISRLKKAPETKQLIVEDETDIYKKYENEDDIYEIKINTNIENIGGLLNPNVNVKCLDFVKNTNEHIVGFLVEDEDKRFLDCVLVHKSNIETLAMKIKETKKFDETLIDLGIEIE